MKSFVLGFALFSCAGAFAEFTIDFDPSAAKPIKDMRKSNCNQGIGFNAALESIWSVASDDYWFVSNKVETSRILKEAGANLLRLQCMNSWFSRKPPAKTKRPSNPKAAFDFYKENGIKVFICLEAWNKDAIDQNVEIVKWIVENKYKSCVAGFEMGNETYGNPKYEQLAPLWCDFIDRASKIWPNLPLGMNIGELFDLNPDLSHMRARLESKDKALYRNTYFSAADYNQFSTRFMLAMAASNRLNKISHIIWHAYGAEEPYSCSYYGFERFRYYVNMYSELLKGKKFWLTEVRQRSDEDNRCQRMFRDSLLMAHFTLMALSQPEVDGFCHHQLTALSGALYQSTGRNWYVQWYDATQDDLPDYRAPGNLPRMEVGHCGVMYRILGEAIRSNPLFYLHGTSKEQGTTNAYYTSASVATEIYAHRKALKERKATPGIKGEVEYVLAGNGRGKYCLLMVNTKNKEETIRLRIAGRQFAAPIYRTLSCPEEFLDRREIPGDGKFWRQLSWEDTQSGFMTWSNWDAQGHKYTPLPSGVEPVSDDLIVKIAPHTVQSVEFQTRAVPKKAPSKKGASAKQHSSKENKTVLFYYRERCRARVWGVTDSQILEYEYWGRGKFDVAKLKKELKSYDYEAAGCGKNAKNFVADGDLGLVFETSFGKWRFLPAKETFERCPSEVWERAHSLDPYAGKKDRRLKLADPFVFYENGLYYAYGTGSGNGIPVATSKDLKTWKLGCGKAKGALALHKDDVWGDYSFWAPEVFKRDDGKYVMTYSAQERICTAISDSPLGPFVQKEKKPIFDDNKFRIDSSIFRDADGKIWLLYTANDAPGYGSAPRIVEMEKDAMTVKKGAKITYLFDASQPWEKTVDYARINEGPFILKHNGLYYITWSANAYENPHYAVGCATSRSICGPYVKNKTNPILLRKNGLYGTGHHSFFTDAQGKLKIVFHAHKARNCHEPRMMYIASASFDEKNGEKTIVIGDDVITCLKAD